MSQRDPLEVLRLVAHAQRATFGAGPSADEVLNRIRAPRIRLLKRRRRIRVIVGGMIAALLATGGGAVWAIAHRSHPEKPDTISCHRFADLASSQIVVHPDETDPVALCTLAWPATFPEWGPPPPMVACVSPESVATVFPGDSSTCAQLGLPALDTTSRPQDDALIALQSAVSLGLADKGCLSAEEVRAILQTILDHSSLTGWTIETIGSFTPEQPCATAEVVLSTQIITISPLADIFRS
jgi:hypothetical protein